MSQATLPQGWTNTTFANVVVSFSNGIGGNQNKEGIGIPVSRIETIADQSFNFNRIGYIAEYDSTKIDKYQLSRGDILFSHINSPIHLGKTAIFEDKKSLYHGINLLRIVVNREVVFPETFNYFCKLTRFQGVFAMRAQHAVNQSSINQKKLGEFEIPLAPLPEQKRIADKLDTVLARVDACSERLNRVPLILKRFRQSVLAAATSGQLTVDWRAGQLEAEPEGISNTANSAWATVIVASLCDAIFDGPFGSKLKSDDYTAQGERVVRLENIGHLSFDISKETYVSQEKYQTLEKHTIFPGDILFSSFVDEEVRVCQLPDDLPTKAINKADCFCIRANKKIVSAKFLTYRLACKSTYITLKEQVHGTTRPRINLKHLKQFEFGLPSVLEQHEIVRRVETLFAFADRLEARLATARAATERLTPALLAKAFRGELVPQDPGDEPAAALLQRLAASRAEAGAKPRRAQKSRS